MSRIPTVWRFGLIAIFSFAPLEAAEPVMIWSVSDHDSTVFLAGTVHLLREEDFPIPAAYDLVYARAEELVFEIDMARMTDPSFALEMNRLGSLPSGEKLTDKFRPDTMVRLREFLGSRKVARGSLDRFTPGMAYLMVGSIEAARNGARADLGLESIYYEKSLRDGKPSSGLETPEFQMSRFDEVGVEMVEQLLREALDEADSGEVHLDAIVRTWKSGDVEGLAGLVHGHGSAAGARAMEVILTDRNRDWIPEIERQLARDRDVLFLVGAAHLVGERSVVDLLRERGHQVLQLANAE